MGSTVFATVSTPGPAGPTGPPGHSPVWIVAAGVPSSGTGVDGDMYINSSTGDVYGPKTAGAWGAISTNIKGPAGPAGYAPQYIVAAGAPSSGTGNNGDMYINSTTSDVYGPKTAGAWGAIKCNIKGSTGSTGPQGPPGIGYTAKGAWAAGTTYAQGDQVSDVSLLYISLQSTNTGHTPASSPTWWQPVGSGAAQTPWASDIDAGTHNLLNAGTIVGNSVRGVGAIPGGGAAIGLDRIEMGVVGGTPRMVFEDNTFTLWSVDNSSGVFRWFTPGFEQMKLSSVSNNALVQVVNSGAVVAVQINSSGNSYFNGGNLGINNGSPGYKLDVTGDINLTGTYRVNGVPLATGGLPAGSSGQVQFNNASAFGASANLFWDITNSRLGIGTGTPGVPLEIKGTATVSRTANSQIRLGRPITTGYAGISFAGVSVADPVFYSPAGTDDLAFGFDNGSSLIERLRVMQTGNVGIGTTTPNVNLDIAGSNGPVNSLENAGVLRLYTNDPFAIDKGPQIRLSGHNGSGGSVEVFSFATIAGRKENATSGSFDGYLQFSTNSSGTLTERMRITSTGNVGIGNTPAYALDVTGDIRCSGLVRNTANTGGAVLAVPDNLGSATLPNGSVTFSFNTSANALIFYVKYNSGVTKTGSINLV